MNIKQALAAATQKLQTTSDTPHIDSEVLLSQVLSVNRSYFHTWPDKNLTAEQETAFNELIHRRQQGEPVAYIVGHKEFWSMEFKVTPDVLIPRPETEMLVEQTLELLSKKEKLIVADLGTGSGAIAIALAKERPQWRIIATDQCNEALSIAKQNASDHDINNIEFHQSDWFSNFPHIKCHVIVSNPPYIEEHDPHLTQGDVRFEPQEALKSGEDGLRDIAIITTHATEYLHEDGYLLIEHGFEQGQVVRELFSNACFQGVKTLKDLAGHERITLGKYNST